MGTACEAFRDRHRPTGMLQSGAGVSVAIHVILTSSLAIHPANIVGCSATDVCSDVRIWSTWPFPCEALISQLSPRHIRKRHKRVSTQAYYVVELLITPLTYDLFSTQRAAMPLFGFFPVELYSCGSGHSAVVTGLLSHCPGVSGAHTTSGVHYIRGLYASRQTS